jgi:hypothetical protein
MTMPSVTAMMISSVVMIRRNPGMMPYRNALVASSLITSIALSTRTGDSAQRFSLALPNTMGRQRAETIAAGLPDTERDLASRLLAFAS